MRFSFNLISHEAHLTTFFRPNYFLHFLPFVLNWLRELHTNNLFLLLFLLHFPLLSIFLISLRLDLLFIHYLFLLLSNFGNLGFEVLDKIAFPNQVVVLSADVQGCLTL